VTRAAATRVVGLVALGGIVALGLATIGVEVASGTTPHTTAVTTSVSFSVDLQAEMPGPNIVHLRVEGVMDFVHHAMAATVTVPNPAPDGSTSAGEEMPAGGSTKLHTEWVDDRAYVAVPSSLSGLAGGAQNVSFPTSSSMNQTIDTVLTQTAVAVSYSKILFGELTAHQTVHQLGSRTIDGVSARGADVELTLTQLLKLVPELSPDMTRDAGTMANDAIPVTVWVDHQGRLVEVTMAATKGDATSVSGTVQFWNYDAPDKVTAPAAETVRPITPALRQLLDGLNLF